MIFHHIRSQTIRRCLGFLYVCCGFFLLCHLAAAEPLVVTITGKIETDILDPAYFYQHLLTQALEKTRPTDGDFVIAYNNHGGGIERDRAMLMAGVGIDIMWGSVTKDREQKVRVIPVELLRDLNNYRALLINKNERDKFDQIKNLSELKQLTTGTGTHWTDGLILKDNGFNVVNSANYSGLFKMLMAHRFNFISRGLHEIGYDLQAYSKVGLEQEHHILLKYNAPLKYCFFVNKENKKLADRVERGLNIMREDGSFDDLFFQMPGFKVGEDILKKGDWIVFELQNNAGP